MAARVVSVSLEALANRPANKPTTGRSVGSGYDARTKGLTVWCSQCDRMVARSVALQCASPFCNAKSAASAPVRIAP